MKHTKKIVSLLLALMMVLGLATTALAANDEETGKNIMVTVEEESLNGHTFTAYRIFSGKLEKGTLVGVDWAEGINSANFLNALKSDATYGTMFKGCATAADVAKVLSDNKTNSVLVEQVSKLADANKVTGVALQAGSNNLKEGYYLIIDTTTDVGEGGAYNANLLQVVGGDTITITAKTSVPSVEKKVKEDDDNQIAGGYGNGYNDVADYTIGDDIPFKLIGVVPDMSNYSTYQYIFHDTMSVGLTLNESSIHVYYSDNKGERDQNELINTGEKTYWTQEVTGQSFSIKFNDLKSVYAEKGSSDQFKYIIVEYTAKLNSQAVIGLNGNPNEVYLEYSNNPNGEGLGKTTKDEVIVFTYKLHTTKVDSVNKATTLQGAQFVLMDSNPAQIENAKVAKIEDGKIVEWVANKAPTKNEDGTIKEEGSQKEDGTYKDAYILTSDEKGEFSIAGLDSGQYYLKEIKAPEGYNLPRDPFSVTITSHTLSQNHKNNENQKWDGDPTKALTGLDVIVATQDGTGDAATGTASIKITNTAGSTLPQTGGIGTTIFYLVGSVLVVGAVVLLVTKRRLKAER